MCARAWCVQGVASALVERAAGDAWGAGVSDLYVHVASTNAGGRQLYVRRCGFAVSGMVNKIEQTD